ncbi:EZH inhibitory protein [Acomys russatus]|uniref:EZH inhibitory protein n=1 Tax=Acomys russatus TaxID=60746 RepID=UPI0021E25774|nr:EZH inhibitory protein [Acomys russatus]
MAASGTISVAAGSPGASSGPETGPDDLQGARDPPAELEVELEPDQPMTSGGGQEEVGQALEGGPPAQRKSSRKRKQPSRYSPDGLQFSGWAMSSLRSQPSRRHQQHHHRSEHSVRGPKSPGLALGSSATKSRRVSPPAMMEEEEEALSPTAATVPVAGHAGGASLSSSYSSGPSTPPGQKILCLGEAVASPDRRGSTAQGGWVLRSRIVAAPVLQRRVSSSEEEEQEEASPTAVRPDARDKGWNLRPRAPPRVPVFRGSMLVSSPERSSRSRHRSRRSRRACSPGSGRQRHEAMEEEEPGPRSLAGEGPSTSWTEFPERSVPAVSRSPPRRPVRMRASSPSPPGRIYPLPSQFHEGLRYSTPKDEEELSASTPRSSPVKTPEDHSLCCDVPSPSNPSPNTLWHALIPDLDNLDSFSWGEPGEEEEEEEDDDDEDAPSGEAGEEM